MELFTRLYFEIDATTRTAEKLDALKRYFTAAPPRDAAWALFFLTGRKLKRAVNTRLLRDWVAAEAGLPLWIVEESYEAVGDLAEALALLLPDAASVSAEPLHMIVESRLDVLKSSSEEQQRAIMVDTWRRLDSQQRMVWHKLITGEFRVGVANTLTSKALAAVAGITPAEMAHRLMGHWDPTAEDYLRLLSGEGHSSSHGRPYPFFLAYPLEASLETLGEIQDLQIEWKWDGIRSQLIRRSDETLLWSRGEELVTDRYPEIAAIGDWLPDGTVLDGEIITWGKEGPRPFALLQRRIGRKTVTAKLLADAPVVFMAYDILEERGEDLRPLPQNARRKRLEDLSAAFTAAWKTGTHIAGAKGNSHASSRPLSLFEDDSDAEPLWSPLQLSPLVHAESWDDLLAQHAQARERAVEGFMLKRLDSPYGVGRQKGGWWKWKVNPYQVDAVLIYAQKGHGRRATLYTDYTFGLWHEGELVPIAKATPGLTDQEINKVDAFVRQNTVNRFGPVRVVRPELVFELAFEGIQKSTRHKAGIAVRFPRMARWRRDKRPEDADTLETLQAMLKQHVR